MTESLIIAERVSRKYTTGRCMALRDVSFRVERNEHVAIMGPSGSGKSTLLHLLCGLDRPSTGCVLFEGKELRTRAEWAAVRARRIGFVFQAFNLLPTLTARQNVQVPMFGVIPKAQDRLRRADELLARVGLSERAGHRPTELSGGERQRLAIARSLANSPDVILADEPTGNLDSHTSQEILDLLADVQSREGTALVIVTHDSAVAQRAHRISHLKDGRMVPA